MEEVVRRCDAPVGRNAKPCGNKIEDNKPFAFQIEGTEWSLDLCEEHREDFKSKIASYIEIATPVRTRSGRTTRQALYGKHGVFTTKDVRRWLTDQGIEVADSGRLPNHLIEKYREAHA